MSDFKLGGDKIVYYAKVFLCRTLGIFHFLGPVMEKEKLRFSLNFAFLRVVIMSNCCSFTLLTCYSSASCLFLADACSQLTYGLSHCSAKLYTQLRLSNFFFFSWTPPFQLLNIFFGFSWLLICLHFCSADWTVLGVAIWFKKEKNPNKKPIFLKLKPFGFFSDIVHGALLFWKAP